MQIRKNEINFGYRKRRNNGLKKKLFILLFLVMMVTIGIKVVDATTTFMEDKKQEKLEQQKQAEMERLKEEQKKKEVEEAKKRVVGVSNEGKADAYDAKKIEEKLNKLDYSNNGEKIVFLTFDDGASTTVTPKILDILKEQDVRATFFVNGANIDRGGDASKELVKRSFEEGNAIANHSYSHDYKYLYPSGLVDVNNFVEDFDKTDKLLKEILGPYFETNVIRMPGGSMSWKNTENLQEYLDTNEIASIDWNAINGDSQGKKKNANSLLKEAINTSKGKEIVVLLMHDTYGKEETIKALPKIINYYKENGYSFKTLV